MSTMKSLGLSDSEHEQAIHIDSSLRLVIWVNLGGAATYCMSSRLEADSLKLRCLNGENCKMRHSNIEFGHAHQ